MNHNISITIPQKVVEKIDKDRGDINRSRYILRLLERAYENLGAKKTYLHTTHELPAKI
jgi:metal-responsive CopG/Arc/MetJ family transcriptional regulator